MKTSNHYPKVIEWSNEDQCYVGTCPSLMYGGCHGDDEKEVFNELCSLVDETITLYKDKNMELPKLLSIEEIYGRAVDT